MPHPYTHSKLVNQKFQKQFQVLTVYLHIHNITPVVSSVHEPQNRLEMPKSQRFRLNLKLGKLNTAHPLSNVISAPKLNGLSKSPLERQIIVAL